MINKTTFLNQCFDNVMIKLQEEGFNFSKCRIKEQLKHNYIDHYSYHSTFYEVLVIRKDYTYKMLISITCEKQFNYFSLNTSKRFNSPQEADFYMQQNGEYRKAGAF